MIEKHEWDPPYGPSEEDRARWRKRGTTMMWAIVVFMLGFIARMCTMDHKMAVVITEDLAKQLCEDRALEKEAPKKQNDFEGWPPPGD